MKFRDLPGFPKLFLDYLDQAPAANAFYPCRPNMESLQSHAAALSEKAFPRKELSSILMGQAEEFQSGLRARENIQRLSEDGTVVVLTGLGAEPFGGPLADYLKCLTAIKLASSLNERGFTAIPLVWIHSEVRTDNRVRVLNREGKAVELEQSASSDLDKLIHKVLSDEIQQENETLQLLRQAYVPGRESTAAVAYLLAKLTDEWGLVIFDSSRVYTSEPDLDEERVLSILSAQAVRLEEAGYPQKVDTDVKVNNDEILSNLPLRLLYQHTIFPTLAYIADPEETTLFPLGLPLYSMFDSQPPIVWPRASATIVDKRSTKILERYRLDLRDLFTEKEALLKKLVEHWHAPDIALRLDTLSAEVSRKLGELQALLPAGDESLTAEIEDSRAKMLYQLGRLKERQVASHILRVEVMTRHIERVRLRLAPDGHLQEDYLSGLHFLLEAPDILSEIHSQIDPWKLEHQIIHAG